VTFLVGHEDLASGATVMLEDFSCWTAEPFNGDCTNAQDAIILEVFAEECGCQCYLISECGFPTIESITYSDLSDLEENEVFSTPDGTCYLFLGESDCEVAGLSAKEVIVDRRFGTEDDACDCCLVPKYSLTPACNACTVVLVREAMMENP